MKTRHVRALAIAAASTFTLLLGFIYLLQCPASRVGPHEEVASWECKINDQPLTEEEWITLKSGQTYSIDGSASLTSPLDLPPKQPSNGRRVRPKTQDSIPADSVFVSPTMLLDLQQWRHVMFGMGIRTLDREPKITFNESGTAIQYSSVQTAPETPGNYRAVLNLYNVSPQYRLSRPEAERGKPLALMAEGLVRVVP